jgi:hypothetical protein
VSIAVRATLRPDGLRSCRPSADVAIAPISYIQSVSRSAETGVYRFEFADADDLITRADLMVAFSVDKGLVDLDYIIVEHVHSDDAAVCAAITAWVASHETEVFHAAMEAW